MPIITEALHITGNIPKSRLSLSQQILMRLPRSFRYKLINQLVKFNIIKRYGKFVIKIYDKNNKLKDISYGYNLVPNVGIQHLGDILAGVEATNLTLAYIEPGSGTTTPAIGDTDTETPLTPADRLAVTSVTRSASSPYEVTAETYVASGKYTRPATINQICVFFGPDETGDLFAKGLLDTPVVLNASESATISYSAVFR